MKLRHGHYAQIVAELTYEEKRDIQQSHCEACKGGPFVFDRDCPDWCEGFRAAAEEMIALREAEDHEHQTT